MVGDVVVYFVGIFFWLFVEFVGFIFGKICNNVFFILGVNLKWLVKF